MSISKTPKENFRNIRPRKANYSLHLNWCRLLEPLGSELARTSLGQLQELVEGVGRVDVVALQDVNSVV